MTSAKSLSKFTNCSKLSVEACENCANYEDGICILNNVAVQDDDSKSFDCDLWILDNTKSVHRCR